MADTERLNNDPEAQLFDQLDRARAGMLGVEGSTDHMQPMTHLPDADEGALYFITSRDTELVRQVGQGATAHHCLVGRDHDYHACIMGTLEQVDDPDKLDELWSPLAGAFFDGGRDDPDVMLLKLTLREAEVWVSSDSAFKVGFEVAKAAVGAAKVDLGEHRTILFGVGG